MTKSSVVSTSYKQTIEPLIELNDDVILVNDNSDAEYSSDMLEKIRKPSTPTTKILPPITDDRRKTMQIGPSISTNYTSFNATEKPIENTSSAYKRRFTTYTTSTSTALRNNNGLDESNEDILKKVETPFLSDFTRRLAELKAEQLPGIEKSFEYKTPKATTSAYLNEYRSSIYGHNRAGDRFRSQPNIITVKQDKPSAWLVWEKKFRLPLLIIVAVFVIVSVYVFLFTNY